MSERRNYAHAAVTQFGPTPDPPPTSLCTLSADRDDVCAASRRLRLRSGDLFVVFVSEGNPSHLGGVTSPFRRLDLRPDVGRFPQLLPQLASCSGDALIGL